MKLHILIIQLVLLCLISSCTKKENEEKWVSLFNNRDLEGWTVKIAGYPLGENYGQTFRVNDSILSVNYDQYDSFNNKFGALYYKTKFKNYRLKVEYRFVGETTPGAPSWGYRDSGIQYHCQDPASLKIDQSFPVCLEFNLHGGNGTDERPVGEICANGIHVEINGNPNESYCTPAQVKRTFHGDQWVTLEIEAKDNVFTHYVNGEEILQFENPRYDSTHVVAKTLIVNNNDTVTEGYISLQSNSHPIDFRKIEILEYN